MIALSPDTNSPLFPPSPSPSPPPQAVHQKPVYGIGRNRNGPPPTTREIANERALDSPFQSGPKPPFSSLSYSAKKTLSPLPPFSNADRNRIPPSAADCSHRFCPPTTIAPTPRRRTELWQAQGTMSSIPTVVLKDARPKGPCSRRP